MGKNYFKEYFMRENFREFEIIKNEEERKRCYPWMYNHEEIDDVIELGDDNRIVIDKIFPIIRKVYENFQESEIDLEKYRSSLIFLSGLLEVAIFKHIKQNESFSKPEKRDLINYMSLIIDEINNKKKEIIDKEIMDLEKIKKSLEFCLNVFSMGTAD